MKVVDLLDMEQRLAVAEKKVARMELRFNSWLTEQCFIYAQIRGEIKYDEREDAEEAQSRRDEREDPEDGVPDTPAGHNDQRAGKVSCHRQGLCSPVLEKGVRDANAAT